MLDPRINTLAAQLSKMTPPQRQKFASLHKNDPIAVGMAKYVNDQENAVRQAFALKDAPAAFQQPSVVDQTIAQMSGPKVAQPMPPTQAQEPHAGVDGLPAPNLASMPDGGIAGEPDSGRNPSPMGYAGGGMVRHFDGSDGSFVDPLGSTDGAAIDPSAFQGVGKRIGDFLTKPRIPTLAQLYPEIPLMQPKPAPEQMGAPKFMKGERDRSPVDMPPPQAGIGAPAQPTGPAPNGASDELMKLLGSTGGGGGGGAPAGIGAPAGPGMAMPKPLDLQGSYDQRMADSASRPDPMENEFRKWQQAQQDAAKGNVDDIAAEQAARGVAGKDRESRLNARSAKLDAEEGSNKGLALLSAGLAMMAGTSPNALANIGNGAQVGVKQYAEGKARIEAARDKIDDAYWQLEELRRTEGRADSKDMREAKNHYREVVANSMGDAYKAAEHWWGVKHDDAMKFMDNAVKLHDTEMQTWGSIEHAKITSAGAVQAAGITSAGHVKGSAITALGHLAATRDTNQMYKQQAALGNLGVNAMAKAEQAIKMEQATDPYNPMSEERKQAIRQHFLSAGQSGGAQLQGIGVGAPSTAAPGFDRSQFTVKPLN